jgi:hypothetical protein
VSQPSIWLLLGLTDIYLALHKLDLVSKTSQRFLLGLTDIYLAFFYDWI